MDIEEATLIGLRRGILNEFLGERERHDEIMHQGNTKACDMKKSKNDWVALICVYASRASNYDVNLKLNISFRQTMLIVGALALAAIETYDDKIKGEKA